MEYDDVNCHHTFPYMYCNVCTFPHMYGKAVSFDLCKLKDQFLLKLVQFISVRRKNSVHNSIETNFLTLACCFTRLAPRSQHLRSCEICHFLPLLCNILLFYLAWLSSLKITFKSSVVVKFPYKILSGFKILQ